VYLTKWLISGITLVKDVVRVQTQRLRGSWKSSPQKSDMDFTQRWHKLAWARPRPSWFYSPSHHTLLLLCFSVRRIPSHLYASLALWCAKGLTLSLKGWNHAFSLKQLRFVVRHQSDSVHFHRCCCTCFGFYRAQCTFRPILLNHHLTEVTEIDVSWRSVTLARNHSCVSVLLARTLLVITPCSVL